jgi:TonB-linked SusC/RagA family outer membrane protein
MKKIVQLTVWLLFMAVQISIAQDRQIKGKVTDNADGSSIAGVAVKVKGTNRGTVTDAEGNYKINAGANNTLTFSSVGFSTREMAVGSASELNIKLTADNQALDEIVVTALGITKDQKVLSYATQSIDTKTFAKARELNVANSLAGRVAGLDIVRASSGLGGSSRVVLRGDRSITGNNQALIVVDGVPLNNSNFSPTNANGGRDASDGFSSINPDDIENMNVLRGASATALYGSRAANGAIIITTKKGSSRNGIGVSINSSFQAEQAMVLQNFQNEYGQGSGGVYNPRSEFSWGPRMTGQSVAQWGPSPAAVGATYNMTPQPSNYGDFYGTGSQLSNSIALSGGSEKTQTYFSYTNVGAKGIVDNNKLRRNILNLRINSELGKNLSLDTKVTYLKEVIDNRQQTGESYANVQRHVLRMPRNISLESAQNFEYVEPSTGRLKQNFWNPGSNGGQNPYWIKNRVIAEDIRDRVTAFTALTYKIGSDFSVMARGGIDKYVDQFEGKWYTNTYTIADNGDYQTSWRDVNELNLDLLGFYKKQLSQSVYLDAVIGASLQKFSQLSQNSQTGGLNRDNLFITTNARSPQNNRELIESEKQGVFATADVTIKNALTISGSVRNDWSSTLAADNRSYLYPSLGFSAILSNMIEMPTAISFAKFRGSIAQTGNDARPFILTQYYTYGVGGPNGFISRDPLKPFPSLKAELTTAYEVGFEAKFMKGRLGFDIGYYTNDTKNQLFPVPIPGSSGWTQEFVNAGLVRNSGIELTVNATPVKMNDFSWDVNLNFASNQNKLVELTPDLKSFQLSADFMNFVRAEEGRPLGEVYSRGFDRNASGQILVDAAGLPRITSGTTVYLGNTRPDWTGGLNNRISYKNLSLSFLISARMGGVVSSFTNAIIYADGVVEETLINRDKFVFQGVKADGSANDVSITGEAYWLKVGGRNAPAGEVFTYSASNIRLRELALSYSLPKSLTSKSPFHGVSISLVGRNLFFLMNNAKGFDPELVSGSQNTTVGLESFSLPSTRTIGLNLNLSF